MKKLTRRLKIIEGQVRGLISMIEKDTYCIDVIAQTRRWGCSRSIFISRPKINFRTHTAFPNVVEKLLTTNSQSDISK